MTGIKACGAIAFTESGARLHVQKLVVLSLFRVLASSIFNLSRVELINEIIECSFVFFFSIYEAAISEWNADYANEALIKIFCPLPLRNLDKRTCCNYKAFWSERFPHVEKFLAATQNRRDTFESVRGR